MAANKRREKDVMKLLVSDFEVEMASESSNNEFLVKFCGPKDSPYEGVSYNDWLSMGYLKKKEPFTK